MCFSTVVGNELSAATIGNNKPNFILTTSHNGIYREKHTEVAEYLGVTYRHLLYVLAKFVKSGILAKSEQGYVIKNKSALRKISTMDKGT